MKSDESETLRKQAEEANSLLAAIVESSDDAIIGKTLDGTILSWNGGAQNIYGYSTDEVKGRSISILVPPDKTDEVPSILQRIRQGQRIERYETVRMRKDGKQIEVSLTISPIKDSTGKIVGASTIARDITERKRAVEELRRAHDELEIRVQERTAELEDANIELEAEITERKRAEEALRESEQRYATTLASIGDAVIATDVEGRITFMNTEAEALTGWTLAEALTKPVTEVFNIINEYTRRDADNPVIRVLKEGIIVGLANHTILVKRDGTEVPIDDSGAPIRDGDGKTMGVVLVFRNITERKRTEEENQRLLNAVQEEKDRLSALVNSISDEIWFADTKARFTLANPSALREFGFSSADGIADGINVEKLAESLEVYRPDGSPRPTEEAPPLRALNGEVVRNLEEIIRTPATGELRYRQVSASPVRDSSGNIIGSVSVVRDITENKQAEEALRESEQRWATTLASIGDAVIATDAEGRITFMNAEAEALTGWTLAEALTKPVTEVFNIINEYTRREADNPVIRVLKEGIIVGLANHTILVKRDGTEVPIDDSGAPIRDGGGKTMGVVLVFRDITERKRAEEALRESEQKFMKLFQGNAAAIALTRLRDRHIIEVNERWQEVFGFSREEVIGGIVNKIKLWKHPEEQMRAIHDLETHGAFRNRECEFFRKNGEVWTGLISSEVIQLQGEGFILTSLVDITERKRAEEALRRSEEKFSIAFHGNIAGMSISQLRDGLIIDANDRWLELFGFRREEVIGKIIAMRAWKNAEERTQMVHDLEQQGAFHNREIHFLKKTGEGWIGMVSAQVTTLYGEPVIISSAIDITERARAEEALRKAHDELEIRVQERTAELEGKNVELGAEINKCKQAEEKIREQAALLDNAQEAVGVRSLEHRLIYWNKGAERLYGWTAEEAIGKNPIEFLFKDKEEPPQLIEAKRIVLEQGEWTGELHQVTKDGREIVVESHWTLICDGEGKPKSILVVNTDITEKKMFEAHLLRAQRMESIGILAGGIAHNLNNMLTPMMMSLHMLKEKLKDEQSQKLLTILEKNSQRGADLIKQVLSFSRGVEGERNPLQVAHIIAEIEKIAKETFPKNIEIRTDIQKDLYTISGDATQLHQVIMNLCVNARDAMPDGGILSISAENFLIDENYARMHTEAKVGSYVAIAVSDIGIGIPPKILDRIFEPFFTTKEFGKGTGLGLSTALAIVKSHGGFINVYSEVGKGTTFRVYLPAIKTEAEMQDVEEQELELLIGHGELVLVAEDEDSVREVTVSTLEKYGYNVLAANDGADAVALYAQNKDKIEVILMDMMMPFMDGEASIRAIRKINPQVKVIVVSGLAEKDKVAKIESTHAQALLPKPYTAEKLLKNIHEVLSAK